MGSDIDTAMAPRKNYRCVQALRAVAAALVVVHHGISMWREQAGLEATRWTNGAAGVDIFFVISGFVMAISLPGLAGERNKAGVFLRRRFARVVPLYWAALSYKLVQTWLAPVWDAAITPWRVVASYLFIPANNGKGGMFPIVTVGWTLNFEIFFYLLFAVALAADIAPLAFLAPCLTGVAILGTMRTAAWPDFTALASTVVMEFLYGMLLAHFAARRKVAGRNGGMLLLAAGFAMLLLAPEGWVPWGFVGWGLPAAAIVAGAVGVENEWGGRLPKWLLEAGDASYALYITHTFVLPWVLDLMRALGMGGAAGLAFTLVAGLGASGVAALAAHRYVERPLMRLFKDARRKEIAIPLSYESSAV
jgi:exopolysaccharide production protein ExoZ